MRIFTDLSDTDSPNSEHENARTHTAANLAGVRFIVAVASAKGGAGKSSIAVNLAVGLALKSRKVAIVDADLNAPSVLPLLGMKRRLGAPLTDNIEPAAGPHGLRVVTSDMLPAGEAPPISFIDNDAALAAALTNHRRPTVASRAHALRTLLSQSRFGALDFLIVDLGPGVGALHEVAALARIDATLLVSHPSERAGDATRRAVELALEAVIPIAGIVENFAGYYCDHCRGVRPLLPEGAIVGLTQQFELGLQARFGFDPRLAESCDRGTLFIRDNPDSPTAKMFAELTLNLERWLAARPTVSQQSA
ncbi:MAG TPA: P-loop NTPase [Candidatus Binataceae bacterium]|nr:P-loop NTPase [Candidatus Binataceae bacterium]